MSTKGVTTFIIGRWMMEHDVTAIMAQLITLGIPITKAEVLKIIRRYIDVSSENVGYGFQTRS